MEIKRQKIKLGKLKQNTGQLDGIPKNPRQWTQLDVEKLAKSIEQTPELLEMRPIIAVPKDERFVIVGGNLRFSALKLLDYKEVDCYILEDAEISKIKEIAIKDNGSFGDWDFDELANNWDNLPLNDWGVEKLSFDEDNVLPEDLEFNQEKKHEFSAKITFKDLQSLMNFRQDVVDELKVKYKCDISFSE